MGGDRVGKAVLHARRQREERLGVELAPFTLEVPVEDRQCLSHCARLLSGRRLLGRMWHEGLLVEPDGTGSGKRVDGEIGEVLVGEKPGRLREADVVFVNPFGMAIEDVALAQAVYEQAARVGIGEVLER